MKLFEEEVEKQEKGEYGHTHIHWTQNRPNVFPDELTVWMSHFDSVTETPKDFHVIYI